MRIPGIPDYSNLGAEALAAAGRMEARAEAPASGAMFDDLVAPLLDPAPATVLEVGCGTAALSRRVARALPDSAVYAADKSEGMLAFARERIEAEGFSNITLGRWDVLEPAAFPFGERKFDWIISSVMVPYLDAAGTADLVNDLATRLEPGGVLAFVEQDLLTDSVNFPDHDLSRRVYAKERRDLKPTLALGLRPLLREAGLELLPRRSFLWTDDRYLPYTRELLEGLADAALAAGRITAAERERWTEMLEGVAASGDFYYGLVYHRVAGRLPV